MSGVGFVWHGLALEARASGALWWPEARWLIVADLHLGKSERMARRGGALLPPYEGLATLERLRAEIEALAPAQVVSLGDGFDDDDAQPEAPAARLLAELCAGCAWVWVAGNHDRRRASEALDAGGVALRHEARGNGPDISGHYHPVVRLAGQRRRAFLLGPQHLILPAFGAYTGGLEAESPALGRWVAGGVALACVPGRPPLAVPLRAQGHAEMLAATQRS